MVRVKKDVLTAQEETQDTNTEPAKKTTRKRKTAAKAATEETAAASEQDAPQPAPKKTRTRKSTAKKEAEPKSTLHFQFAGKDVVAADLLEKALQAYKEANEGAKVETIDIYVVAEEGAAYCVINGDEEKGIKLGL